MKDKTFIKQMLLIALPISIQSLFQASLSVIDQIMVGQLGESSISAIAFGGKYMGIITFTLYAISGSASILMAQFIGKKDIAGVKKAFSLNLFISFLIGIIFFIVGFFASNPVISLYTNDSSVILLGSDYLHIVSLCIFPIFGTAMLNVYLQNNKKAYLTMIAGLASVILNTLLNALFIFGYGKIEPLGVKGAAIATVLVQYTGFILVLVFSISTSRKSEYKIALMFKGLSKPFIKNNLRIAAPLLITEFMWSLGESVYASIYGHISTESMAAMANVSPIISLSIGFFSGLAAAAGILTGQKLGEKNAEQAYIYARRFIVIEIVGSLLMALLVILISNPYVKIFNVSEESKAITKRIMFVYALVLWTKVSNMVAGRIIQSGGKTTFNLIINLIGTWVFGIPLGFLAAKILELPIEYVYLIISLEELVRCILCFGLIKSKKWINFIEESPKANA